jgi:hypothetical protein
MRLIISIPQLSELIAAIDRWTHPRWYPAFQWAIGPIMQKGRCGMPVEITLTNEQQVMVTAHPITAGGHPVQVDGPVQFSIQEGDCTLVPVDNVSAMIVSGNTLADSVVLVQADADLGDGVQTIMDTILIHVQHANASSLGLVIGEPEQKP